MDGKCVGPWQKRTDSKTNRLLLVALALVGCQTVSKTSVEPKAEVVAATKAWEAAANICDASAIAALYADGAVLWTDYAIWRRIRLVPFTITIPEEERDKALPEKLKDEAAGILAWAVQGCLEWQRRGLGAPEEVKAATDSYREEMDVLGEFLKDRCRQSPDAKVSSKELSEAYTDWCEVNGQEPVAQRAFVSALTEKGFKRSRVGHAGVRGWIGIGLA
jgi:hypothetical protein